MQAKIPLGHSGWRTGLLFAWAIWWGGLSFYALFVVPIGTEIVGGFEQGFITQRVTNWLNAIGVIVTLRFGLGVDAGVNDPADDDDSPATDAVTQCTRRIGQ